MPPLHSKSPVGGLFFHETADFAGEIRKMRNIGNGILKSVLPPEITLTQADRMISTITRAEREFQKNAANIINDPGSAFVRDQLKFSARVVTHDYDAKIGKLKELVGSARSQGKSTVPSNLFKPNLALMLFSIAGAYEALEEIDSYKPWWLRMQPSYIVGLMATVGNSVANAATFVGSTLSSAIDAASTGTQMMISILKWGSVAGGLYLLFKTLEPSAGGK